MSNTENMKVLITGGFGHAASYLSKFLIDKGIKVYSMVRMNSNDVRHHKLGINGKTALYVGDLTDKSSVDSIIKQIQPDIIYNMAAVMHVGLSWTIPYTTHETNTIGLLNVLEAVLHENMEANVRVIQASTSECYGHVNEDEVPIKETNPLRPKSPYGIAKVAAENLCKVYADEYGIDVVISRAFNHSGAYQSKNLVIPSFAREVLKYAFNGGSIKHGNLDSIRDFTHVKDVVRGYHLLGISKNIKKGEAYNICSGKEMSCTMGEIMELIIHKIKYTYDIKYQSFQDNFDPVYYRPNDVKLLIGDATKMKKATGWKPKISMGQIVSDTVGWIFEEEFKNE